MRWVKKYYKHGEQRIVKKFALRPIVIEDSTCKETRWLEIVYMRETYIDPYIGWSNCAFVTRDEYIDFVAKSKDK